MSDNILQDISSGIYFDLGSPVNLPASAISGRLLTSGFLGNLDTVLYECHWIDYGSGVINPPLNGQESNIYSELFKATYFRQLASQVINNIGNPSSFAYSLADGDAKIVLSDPVNLSRICRDMEKQAMDRAKYLIYEYNKGRGTARVVNYPTIQAPTQALEGSIPSYTTRGLGY